MNSSWFCFKWKSWNFFNMAHSCMLLVNEFKCCSWWLLFFCLVIYRLQEHIGMWDHSLACFEIVFFCCALLELSFEQVHIYFLGRKMENMNGKHMDNFFIWCQLFLSFFVKIVMDKNWKLILTYACKGASPMCNLFSFRCGCSNVLDLKSSFILALCKMSKIYFQTCPSI
jgi:hypothetical protein